MTGQGQEHSGDRVEGCRGKTFRSRSVAVFCWGSILLASHRLPPSSLPKSVSAAPLPAVTKQNSFERREDGNSLQLCSLTHWKPGFPILQGRNGN